MTEIIITLQQHNNNTITIIVYHISSFWITNGLEIKSHENEKFFLPNFSNAGRKEIIKLKMTMINVLPFLKKKIETLFLFV